jgi:hypothetical protein
MNTFAVQASIISEQAIVGRLLCRYELAEPFTCEFHKHGVNDTYRVLSADRLYFLRIYTPMYADPYAIQREMDLLRALDRSGLSVGAPVADRDGEYIQAISAPEGPRYAVLFSVAKDRRSMSRMRSRLTRLAYGPAHFTNPRMLPTYRACVAPWIRNAWYTATSRNSCHVWLDGPKTRPSRNSSPTTWRRD